MSDARHTTTDELEERTARRDGVRAPRDERHPSAAPALILSVLGLVFWPLAVGGIVLGNRVKRDARRTGGYVNEGLATAARILGWIVVVLGVLVLVGVIVLYALFVGSGPTGTLLG